ncbi:MAG: YCF48-related protein [Prolixibacteraceae bacterium]
MTLNNDGTANLIGYGQTFKKSFDQGLTWNNVEILSPDFDFIDMSIKGNIGYIVSARTTIIDNPSKGESDVKAYGNILKTTDGGETWNALSLDSYGQGDDTGLNPMAPGCYDVDFQAVECVNDTIALTYSRWVDLSSGTKITHSAILKTIDGGKTWKAISSDLASSVISSIKTFGDDIFMGGNQLLYKGNVANDVLIDLYPILDEGSDDKMYISDMEIYNNTELCIITIADGIYTTNDKGATYSKINGVSGANDFLKLNDNVMIEIGGSSASKATIDGGAHWTACYPGKTCWEIGGILNDSIYALAAGIIYKMAVTDLQSGNYKWTSTTIHGTENLNKMHVFDENKALIIGYANGFLTTSDKGVSWTDKTLPEYLIYGANYDYISLSNGEDGASYASTRRMKLIDYPSSSANSDLYISGIIVSSVDNWETWNILDNTKIGANDPADVSKNPFASGCYSLDNYALECVNAKTVYLYADWNDSITTAGKVTSHSRIFKTADGGESWIPVTIDFGSTFIFDISFKGDTGYIAGNKVLMKTVDGGATFTDLYPIIIVGTDGSLINYKVKMLSGKELYVVTSSDGIFYTNNGGESFSKIANNNGASDLALLDHNSFMALGSSTKTKFTNNGGETWTDCYPGSTVWNAGEILNDSLYVLCKSSVYKIAVSDLDIKTSVRNLTQTNEIKVLYGVSELKLVSSDKMISRCFVYNIEGKLINITEPRAKECKFSYNSYTPGIYILAAEAEGKRFTQKVVIK